MSLALYEHVDKNELSSQCIRHPLYNIHWRKKHKLNIWCCPYPQIASNFIWVTHFLFKVGLSLDVSCLILVFNKWENIVLCGSYG